MTARAWRALVLVLVTAVIGLSAALMVALRALSVAEQRSCALVVALDSTYRQAPPQTPAGREIADRMAQLRADYDC
ncbi:hypothetical protein E1091_02015 [Micromonospora fluostatini]|uniref:Uncharacterized protein n=1 Tax=Micromonospora fluostatini TaxID=1629071 RepID=A0ABY2DL85_9ACTN|nr:hypothetical protein E1091_02015 [Micromonospora fluostatini]